MNITVGIGLAFVAMLCWGFGDFLIQKTTRKLGDWETLFLITLFGAVVLLPFVWKDLPNIFSWGNQLLVLLIAGTVLFIAGLIDFEALREGKLAVVEPIWSFEVPAAAFLAFFILGERISVLQIILVVLLVISLFLVSFREKTISKKFFLEKGVWLAFLGAFVMGAANFFMGWGGRVSDPLMVNFFTDAFIMILTGIYLIVQGKFVKTFTDLKDKYKIVLPMSIADKVAWLAFVFSMSLAPIAVATALSESYIIVAVILGIAINKEKLQVHQKIGLIGAVTTAVILAIITTN